MEHSHSPLVTVLLPTHDRADVLGFAIRSVLAQSIGDFELLIAGDGCRDDTRRVVASFNDSRIVWLDLPKAPLSGYANRNIALRQARGQFVAYAQDDDLWFADHLEQLTRTIEAAGADWACSRPLWVCRDGAIVPSPVNLTLPDELDWFMTTENSVPSTCVLHRRDALDRAGYWPEDVPHCADWRCWQSILRTGEPKPAAFCRAPTSLHFPSIRNHAVARPEAALRDSAGAPWWPALFRQTDTRQEGRWAEMSAGGPAWASLMRAATDTVLDHVALTAMRELKPMAELLTRTQAEVAGLYAARTIALEAVRAEIAAHTAGTARARAEAEAAHADTEAARADTEAARADTARALHAERQARTDAAAAAAAACAAQTRAAEADAIAQAARASADLAWAGTRQANTESEAALEVARHSQQRLGQLYRSRSWQITAPLRAVMTTLRRS